MSGTGAREAATRASGRPWEVWLAHVRFADHPDVGKVRPVVIIDEEITAIVVAKVTTAEPQGRFLYCELADWRLAVRAQSGQGTAILPVSLTDKVRPCP